MNEFNRKTMQFVDLFENAGRRWASASPQNAYRVKEERDELRAALVAHLEGAEQTARQAALEEAAQVCEAMHDEDRPGDYAYAIRALANEEKG